MVYVHEVCNLGSRVSCLHRDVRSYSNGRIDRAKRARIYGDIHFASECGMVCWNSCDPGRLANLGRFAISEPLVYWPIHVSIKDNQYDLYQRFWELCCASRLERT